MVRLVRVNVKVWGASRDIVSVRPSVRVARPGLFSLCTHYWYGHIWVFAATKWKESSQKSRQSVIELTTLLLDQVSVHFGAWCIFDLFSVKCFATLHPAMSVRRLVCPLFGQRPRKGQWPMLSHRGIFSFFMSVPAPQIPVSRPKFQSRGPNPSLEAQIPWGPNPSSLGFGPQRWDLGLEVG